jgi:ribosomal subunit interface protein
MKITVTGHQLEVSEATRALIGRKLGRIERVLDKGAVSARCTASRERGQYVFEATLHARADHMLHGVGRSTRLATAVAGAFDKVSLQAERLADRWKTRRRTPVAARKRQPTGQPRRAARAAEPEAKD